MYIRKQHTDLLLEQESKQAPLKCQQLCLQDQGISRGKCGIGIRFRMLICGMLFKWKRFNTLTKVKATYILSQMFVHPYLNNTSIL